MENEEVNYIKGTIVDVAGPKEIAKGRNQRGEYVIWGGSIKIKNHEGVREYRTKTFFKRKDLEDMLANAIPGQGAKLGLILNDRNYQDIVSIEPAEVPASYPASESGGGSPPGGTRDKLILAQVALKCAVEFAKGKPKMTVNDVIAGANDFEGWLLERMEAKRDDSGAV